MGDRAMALADEFEVVATGFRELVQGLTEEQWRMPGRNHPTIRRGDEDEGRPVGVIAYHTAAAMRRQSSWLPEIAAGRPVPPAPQSNEQQAAEHAGATQDEVVQLLDGAAPAVAAAVRALTDEELDRPARLIMGEMSVGEAVKRVVIGHILWHRGSIEATVLPVTP